MAEIPIRRAIISVTDKSGLIAFVKGLRKIIRQIDIIASGGTAAHLEMERIDFTPLSQYISFPECLGGRVKTLHPLIAGGILMKRGDDDAEAKSLGIHPIDLVICNLYDFASASRQEGLPLAELMESMDIGGSTLIRSACKNYHHVALLVDPNDYPPFLNEIVKNKGKVSLPFREKMAVKGINLSADYESLLTKVLNKKLCQEETDRPHLREGTPLRYGENPDQKAWVYKIQDQEGIAKAQVLAGKELSYNNYDDATVAYNAGQALFALGADHGVAIIKHGSLCAYATGQTLEQAFDLAWEGDSKSAFGSVIAMISAVKEAMADKLKNKFIEVLIAPEFDPSFIAWAKKNKPKLCLLQLPNECKSFYHYKNISGGMLIQTQKQILTLSAMEGLMQVAKENGEKQIGVVTHRLPVLEQKGLYAFGIAAVNFAKSNAVAIVRELEEGAYQLIGMGAGQPNRVDSLERLAIPKAIENLREKNNSSQYDPKIDLGKCVLASDGFFPFDDSIRYAAAAGLKNCIQPGGSMRDEEIIKAADDHGICMIFTGERYFYH